MRIIAGSKKGYKIIAPDSGVTRPTSDMVRSAIFNILEHGEISFNFDDVLVIDLFAGSGTLGLEALSRGARVAFFIEQNPKSVRAIKDNIYHLEFEEQTKVIRWDVMKLSRFKEVEGFDIIFIDPPYGKGLAERAVKRLQNKDMLKLGSIVVVEEDVKTEIKMASEYQLLDRRIYGNTAIEIFKYMKEEETGKGE